MHRIDTSTATPDHKFTEGDPTIPVAATTVSAPWLNAVQEELVAVITGVGLELKKSDNGQLWQAISQLITNAKPGLATKAKPGLVQVGGGLNITPEGLLSVLAASVTQAGIVQLASGLSNSTTTAPPARPSRTPSRASSPPSMCLWAASWPFPAPSAVKATASPSRWGKRLRTCTGACATAPPPMACPCLICAAA